MTKLTEFAPTTSNWKLTLAYDGTDFSGWQVQPSERTIQGELQQALGALQGNASAAGFGTN